MPILYFNEDIQFKLNHPRKISHWIQRTVAIEKSSIKYINYIFCSDGFLLTLNQDFLKHNTFTDIITFDYSASKQSLEAEIYISIDRVQENAKRFKKSMDHELQRVIIHGILHLVGYRDKTDSEKALMRNKEDAYLSLYK